MNDYISREAACRTIIGLEMRDCTGCRRYKDGIGDDYCFNEALLVACNAISAIPAADVAEVRHGHWKPWKYKGMGLLPISGYQCSRCGVVMDGIEDTPTAYHLHYCPNCGAKMDESEDEDNG